MEKDKKKPQRPIPRQISCGKYYIISDVDNYIDMIEDKLVRAERIITKQYVNGHVTHHEYNRFKHQ